MRPARPHVDTSESPIQVIGVFAAGPFRPGEPVLRIDDSRVVTDAEPLDPERDEEERYRDYLAGGKVVLAGVPGTPDLSPALPSFGHGFRNSRPRVAAATCMPQHPL